MNRLFSAIAITMLCVGVSWCNIRSARADEASDYLAAAGDEVKALSNCTYDRMLPLVRTQMTEDQIVDQAFADCSDKVGAVRSALMGGPTHLSASAADQAVQDLLPTFRASLAQSVKKRRGS